MTVQIVGDGTAEGTSVFTADGNEITGITFLTIVTDTPDHVTRAVLIFDDPDVDMEKMKENHTLKFKEQA